MTTYKAGEVHGPKCTVLNARSWPRASKPPMVFCTMAIPRTRPRNDHPTGEASVLLLKLCRGTKSAESSVRETSRQIS